MNPEVALAMPVRLKAKKGEGKKALPLVNSTGFRGVKARRKGFVAYIMIAGVTRYSRQFSKPEEAHAWYSELRLQHPKIREKGKRRPWSTRKKG
jgi:hypothetical protein